jgi:hypothetical protein
MPEVDVRLSRSANDILIRDVLMTRDSARKRETDNLPSALTQARFWTTTASIGGPVMPVLDMG